MKRRRKRASSAEATGGKGHSALRVAGSSAGSKIVVMVLSGALSLVTIRLITGTFGKPAYAQYGLLAGLGALLPFADMGMAAAVVNTISGSADPRTDPKVRATLLSAFRVLCLSALSIMSIGLVITGLGLWPTLLGSGLQRSGGNWAVMACIAAFAVTLPLGIGQRMLTGLGKNQLWVSLQALGAPFIVGSVSLLAFLKIHHVVNGANYLAVLTYLASTIVALACVVFAARSLRPQVGAALRAVPKVRSVKGSNVLGIGWPMLVQMLALPIAMQTDRLLLSHLSGPTQLAQYNLASNIFGYITQMISTAGIALWPIFARARARGEVHSPMSVTAAFVGGAVSLATVLAIFQPWIAHFLSHGKIALNLPLVIGFVVFIAAQAGKYPLGMYMTDHKGLRFQIAPILVLVPMNLAISWWLCLRIGAGGPIIGSAISVTLCQFLPNLWYVRRDLAQRRLASNKLPRVQLAQRVG